MNLTEAEREELLSMQRSRTMAVGQVRRARLILLLDEGASRGATLAGARRESWLRIQTRNETLSLFAVLNVFTGEVLGKTAPRHTSVQFVAFLTEVVSAQPAAKEIHMICDNVSSHKTDVVQTFLANHTNVSMHYTPTYSSWLNQVENGFARIQRDVITRGIFNSIKDLDKKLMRISANTTSRLSH